MTRALIALSFFLLATLLHAAPPPVAPPAPIPAVAPPGAAGAICRLRLEGHGTKPGLKTASLSCTGGTITAAAAPELLKALGDSNVQGVVWSDACKNDGIVLGICNASTATFVNPRVSNIWSLGDTIGTILDVSTGSSITLLDGTFSNSTLRPLYVSGNATRVTVQNCAFVRNNAELDGGAVYADSGVLVIRSCLFVENQGLDGGAISANTRVDVDDPPGGRPSYFINNRASGDGGDIHMADWGELRMHGTQLSGASAHSGGAIALCKNSSASLVNVSIVNATAEEGDMEGAGIALRNNARVAITNSTISGCSCDGCSGSAISAVNNSTVALDGVRLVNNFGSYGSGLGLWNNASLVLSGRASEALNNTATNCGAGLALSSRGFTMESVRRFFVAANNSAAYAADVCISVHKVEVVSTDGDLENFVVSTANNGGVLSVLVNVSGPLGLPADDPLQIFVYNELNATVAKQIVHRQGSGQEEEDAQGLRRVKLKLRHPPGIYRLEFGVPDEDAGFEPAELQVRIVSCPVGYVTASSGDGCNLCVRGYFSFNPADSECSMCVQNARCPGGAVVSPAPGFWHSSPRSIQMHRCMNPAACPGVNNATTSARNNSPTTSTTDYKAAQCAEGYSGNLCGSCSAGHGKSRPFVCRKCMSRAAIVALYLTAALGMLGLVKLLVYFARASNDTARPSLKQPLPVELLKVLVLHCQWLFIMSNLVGIPWPATVLYPLQAVAGIWSSTSGSSLGFECILPRNSIPVAIQKVLICLLTPVGILCVVLAVEGLLHLIKPRAKTAAVHHEFASLVVSIVFLFLPAWVSTAFSLFTCVQLDTQPASPPYQADAVGSYWAEDMNQRCYAGYHRGWSLGLGIPLVLLFCVVLPAGVFVFMWLSRKRGRLAHTSYQRHYGFLYRLWREEVCWWESVVVLQTIGLVMVSTFGFALGSYYQGLVTQAVLGTVLVLLLWVRPFKCAAVNIVAVQSACVLYLTAYTALTFLPFNSLQPGPVYGNIMGVVLVLLNVVFLAATVWKLFRVVDWSAARQFVCGTLSKGCVGSSLPAAAKQRGLSRSRPGDKCVGAAEAPPAESKDVADVGCGQWGAVSGVRSVPK